MYYNFSGDKVLCLGNTACQFPGTILTVMKYTWLVEKDHVMLQVRNLHGCRESMPLCLHSGTDIAVHDHDLQAYVYRHTHKNET